MLVYDNEGKEHNKDPVDVMECVRVLGWRTTKEKQKISLEPSTIEAVKRELTALGVDYSGVSGNENLILMLKAARNESRKK